MENILKINNVSTQELVDTYQTPLYIYDINKIKDKIHTYKEYFQDDELSTEILYASKAFSIQAMIQIIKEEGLGLDVVSGGELYTALQAGFDPEHIHFHGNNKSKEEIQYAIDSKVHTFIIDNLQEAQYVSKIMQDQDYTLHTLLRLNPGIEAHTHKYIMTADIDSKFGVSTLKKDEIQAIIDTLQSCQNIYFEGFHAHIGSQIFDKGAFELEIETLCKFISDMHIDCDTLDLGGGFAATYTNQDKPMPLKVVAETILNTSKAMKQKYGLSFHKIMIEPGRSIVAEAGSTLYTIGFSKETLHKKYVFVDGGMADNIRPALYQAEYACDVANKMNKEKTEKVCIAGKCCESGDVLIEECMIPPVQEGDILIVYTTGAYGFSMANNYNRLRRPAVVFIEDGKHQLVVKRQSYEDLLKGECL